MSIRTDFVRTSSGWVYKVDDRHDRKDPDSKRVAKLGSRSPHWTGGFGPMTRHSKSEEPMLGLGWLVAGRLLAHPELASCPAGSDTLTWRGKGRNADAKIIRDYRRSDRRRQRGPGELQRELRHGPAEAGDAIELNLRHGWGNRGRRP
jgi:hypothetical protein